MQSAKLRNPLHCERRNYLIMTTTFPQIFSLILTFAFCASFSSFTAAAPKNSDSRPNIILIYSDDHGWADVGAQGSDKDIQTPNLDQLTKDGVRFVRGYVSAPQCVPSRAGVMTGRYQQRFGVEDNNKGPLPLAEQTIAELLKPAGYVSCQVGKWHLEQRHGAGEEGAIKSKDELKSNLAFLPGNQGFDEYFTGAMNNFVASHDLQGHKLADAPQTLSDKRFRCIWQADAAISFIDRHADDPFFLYLAFYTPHVPLESPEPWFSETPDRLPKERRQALAMIAAMDDGIGRLRAKLREQGNEQNTLIFFIGDNGAPLKQGAWNGSLNLPLVGEKGMLTDGGVRTPFLAAWPGTLPAGAIYEPPVINFDVAATAVAIAGLPHNENLDGVNLLPFLLGEKSGNPHDALYWRWRSQAAIRADHWKLILLGKDEKFLFDLNAPEGESELAKNNLISKFPDIAANLEEKLIAWDATLQPPGLPSTVVDQDQMFYDSHVIQTGIKSVKNRADSKTEKSAPAATLEWVAQNVATEIKDGALHIVPDSKDRQRPFIAFPGLTVAGPAIATADIRSEKGGKLGIEWRLNGQKQFVAEQTVFQDIKASTEFQKITFKVPAKGSVIHIRLLLPDGTSDLRRLEIKGVGSKPAKQWNFESIP